MTARQFLPDDYETFSLWHSEFGMPTPPRPTLPMHGVVVEEDGTPLCMGFVYLTDSTVCVLEHFIKRPETSKAESDESLDLLVDSLCKEAKAAGSEVAIAFSPIPAIIERAKKMGFNVLRTTTSLAKGI